MQNQYLHGPMTWKVTRRNVWKDIANLQIKRLNNYTKSQGFLLEPRKNYVSELQGNLMQKSYLLSPTTWKVVTLTLSGEQTPFLKF